MIFDKSKIYFYNDMFLIITSMNILDGIEADMFMFKNNRFVIIDGVYLDYEQINNKDNQIHELNIDEKREGLSKVLKCFKISWE